MTDILLDSLRRRMRAMHSLYHDAVATMDTNRVNHFFGVAPDGRSNRDRCTAPS